MGQKVHPFGFRLGIFEDWNTRWFEKKSYGQALMEDFSIRAYLDKVLDNSEVAKVCIDKTSESIKITIFSGKPGLIIGKKGQGIEQLKNDLHKQFKKNIEVSVQEVRNPELSAELVAANIAAELSKRASYKKLMKKAGFAALKAGAKGIKICCSGRLGGAEIARSEWLRLGSIPLHSLRANINYALKEAHTTYGVIGVKVWICKGEY